MKNTKYGSNFKLQNSFLRKDEKQSSKFIKQSFWNELTIIFDMSAKPMECFCPILSISIYATPAPPYQNLETTNNFNKAWLSSTWHGVKC